MAEQRKIAGLPRNVAIAGGVGLLALGGYLWWRHRQAAAGAAAQDSSASQGGYSGAAAPVPALAYGANVDEIIATVNGPSVGQGDDDEGKPPTKPKPREDHDRDDRKRKPPKRKPPKRAAGSGHGAQPGGGGRGVRAAA